MKSLKKIIMSVLIFSSVQLLNPEKASAQASVSFQVFYDQLSPYGQWVDYPQYGYVWVPTAEPGFTPYSTGGHWVMTDFGWTWVSDYNWGWAPFHYGRWNYDNFYGWMWVPGHEWGPAWVCWRHARGYYGWTPLEPGISLEVAFGPRWNVPHERWVFVQEGYINHPRWNSYMAPRNQNVTIIQNSTVINNTYIDNSHHATYVSGPRRDDVQRVTRTPVNTVALKESSRPEQSLNNNELKIYRPAIQEKYASGAKPAPRKVVPLKEVHPVNNNAANESPQRTISPSSVSPSKSAPTTVAPSKPARVNAPDQPQNTDHNRINHQPSQAKPVQEQNNRPTDVNREQQPSRPINNTIDKSHQRPVDHQRKVSPVQREHPRNDKQDEHH